jgi:tape measure domain-containing protein
MASNSLGSLVIELGASVATLQSDFARAQAITDKAIGDINLKINSIGSSANFSGVSAKVQGLTGDFNALRNVLVGLVGIDLSVGGLEKLAALADDYQNVSNRIRTTVSDSQQLAAVQKQVFDAAQATGSELDSTAKTYQRLFQVIEGTGKSQLEAQSEAIALTKTLNQEIIVSGVSSAEASRAIMDLVHGLAGGELQARQFNQIMRQFPDLAKQIALGLGVSTQQLEKMVHAGLPAEQVLKALAAQSGEIETKFKSLPTTFGRAWTELTNAVEKYVGEAAQGSVISEAMKNEIIGIANNIGTVAIGAEAVGVAMAGWLGSRGLQALGGMITLLGDAVTAQGVYKTSTILSAEADIANAAAIKAAAAATIAKADALNDLRVVELGELQVKQESLIAEQALLEAQARSLPVGVNILASEERLITVRTELSASTARLTELESLMAASQARATLAEQAEVAATVELTAAKTALAAAQAEATTATGLFSRAGSGLLAAVGGLPTLLIAAGAGIIYLASRESDLAKEADALARITDDVTRAHANLTPALEKTAEAALNEAQANLKAAEAALASSAATTKLSIETRGLANFNSNNSGYAKAAADVERLTAEINNLTGAYLKAKFAAAGKSLWEAMFPDMRSALAQIDALTPAVDKQTAHFAQLAATYGKGHAALVEYEKAQELTKLSLGHTADEIVIIKKALDEKYAADIAAAKSADAVTAATKEQHKELTAQERALRDYQGDLGKLTDLEEQLASGLGGPYLAALRTYQKEIDLTAKTYGDAYDSGKVTDELINRLSDDQEHAHDQWQRANEQIKAQHDQFALLNEQLQLQQVLMHTAPQDQAAVTAGMQAYNTALKAGVDLYGDAIPLGKDIKDVLNAQLPVYIQLKQRVDDETAAVKVNAEIQKQWQQIVVSGFDSVGSTIAQFATGGIKTWHDFGKALVGDAKTFIAAIIQQFLKLTVFNGIINSLFGLSGSSALPTGLGNGLLGSVMGGGSSGGGIVSGLFGNNAGTGALNNVLSGANSGNGLMGFLFGSSGAVDLGGAGVLSGAGAFSGAVAEGAGGYAGYLGDLGDYGAAAGAPAAAGGGLGMSGYLGIAGGALAGYNEFQNAGGGVAGILGGAAYGIGTVMAAGAVSGALGLSAAGAAVGGGLAGAAAGGTAAAGSVGLAAIPVIGWIALAAMLIDKFSGGKLFGTGGKVVGGNQTTSISDDGADVTTNITKKGQHAFFGGAYWKEHQIASDPKMVAAENEYAAQLKAGGQAFADFFNEKFTGLVAGTFETMFDKNGKQTGTVTNIGGQTYKDETGEQFGERLQADMLIKQMDAMGLAATEFTSGLQGDADKLIAAAQDMATVAQNAYANINAGFKFLALGADETLPQVMAFAQGLMRGGETLTQTYQRLMQAQQQYDQFVGQFKAQTVYVDSFEASLSKLFQQMLANKAQADALAKAAGAQGAASEDLMNIQKSATAQMAQLVVQLEASAQQLAFSLGLTTMGSLDQINAEIERLTSGSTESATNSIAQFGNAMQVAGQKANESLNLLLGNLSPLNDQQKLQAALQGLRAGSVSADQVLTIGRSLYASSEAYNQLFNQVMQYADRGSGGGGITVGGGSSSASSSSSHTLSEADQQRLAELMKERDQLQAAATMQQYQTLAQQIEEIATAKGESFETVIHDMGIDIEAFEKALGLKSQADLDTYLGHLKDMEDSAGANTQSIVNAVNALPQELAAIINGDKFDTSHIIRGPGIQPVVPPTTPAPTAPAIGPMGGGRGNAERFITDADAAAIADAWFSAGTRLQDRGGYDEMRSGRRGMSLLR